jgi:hypothetical protein
MVVRISVVSDNYSDGDQRCQVPEPLCTLSPRGAAAEQILEGVDQQIAELQASRDMLRVMLRQWDARLAKTPPYQPARLLDSLSAPIPPNGRAASTHLRRAR